MTCNEKYVIKPCALILYTPNLEHDHEKKEEKLH